MQIAHWRFLPEVGIVAARSHERMDQEMDKEKEMDKEMDKEWLLR